MWCGCRLSLTEECLSQGAFVPLQGFLNALAYGWTRGDFLSVMSRRRLRRYSRQPPDSLGTSYNAMMEEEEEEEDDMLQETEDEEELERSGDILRETNSIFSRRESLTGEGRRGRTNSLVTPTSPRGFLGDY